MEINNSKTAINHRVDVIFSGLETPILEDMLRPYSQVEEEHQPDHTDSLLMDMCEQVHEANRDEKFVFSVKEEDLNPLIVGLKEVSKRYLGQLASFGFSEDVELELAIVRAKLISSLAPGEEDSEIEIEESFNPRHIAKSMAFDFANPGVVTTSPAKPLV